MPSHRLIEWFVIHDCMETDETIIDKKEGISKRFITVAKARRALGMISKNYTDADLENVIGILYGMAEVAHEEYRENADQSE